MSPRGPGQQGKPGGNEHGGNRPGKPNQSNNPKGPDKLSGGGMPPGKKP
jgi:hypothetical protein